MRASRIVRSAALPALVLVLLMPTATPMTHMMDSPVPPAGPQLWKSVFLCGTELEQLAQVCRITPRTDCVFHSAMGRRVPSPRVC